MSFSIICYEYLCYYQITKNPYQNMRQLLQKSIKKCLDNACKGVEKLSK